ncbi:MAG: cysteine desulfurase [Agromyces sp.]|nr:cysteine desulfurase [Agromyces sp.]
MIFLDHAATTPVRREALEAMWPFLTNAFGNPSSHHGLGDEAARALAAARADVAGVIGCRPGDVVFTSGGTEADNLAIKGIALANPRGRHVVVSPIEHEAVLESADHLARVHGFEVSFADVDDHGLVHPEALARVIRPDTTLVSVQLANNEIGTVQPIAELAAIAHASGAAMHTDAVQAAGWLPLSLDALGADAISLAGHKVGAPKGTGALIVRGRVPLEPVLHGGGQERGRRSGTENVAGAVAFATALRLAEAERADAASRVGGRGLLERVRVRRRQRRAVACPHRHRRARGGRADGGAVHARCGDDGRRHRRGRGIRRACRVGGARYRRTMIDHTVTPSDDEPVATE